MSLKMSSIRIHWDGTVFRNVMSAKSIETAVGINLILVKQSFLEKWPQFHVSLQIAKLQCSWDLSRHLNSIEACYIFLVENMQKQVFIF